MVESYIYGLGNGDFSLVPFADDASYESPLTPKRGQQDADDRKLKEINPYYDPSSLKEAVKQL